MAIGFNTTSDHGSRQIVPDKGLTSKETPRVYLAAFGDGYEQRLARGINALEQNFSLRFRTRTKEEIDDMIAFFVAKKGVTAFDYVVSDSNAGGSETTYKVVCSDWSKTYAYDNFYTATATFRRVYEA
tara:strand:- start:1343 stop:1726 length:384 start_codon:yes stop_codon:yes gene_type:complete